MIRNLALIVVLAVLVVSPKLAACGEAPPYSILDSGVWASTNWSGDVYWVDNERVLFLGDASSKPVPKDQMSLLEWDTAKHSIIMLKQNISSLCYRNGIVLLGQKVDSPAGGPWKYRFFQGPLGNERPQVKGDTDLLDHMNCRIVKNNTANDKRPPGRYLLEKDGYLGRSKKRPPEQHANLPAMYFKEGESEGIPLPFGVRQIESVEYYDFKRAYFLYGWFYDSAIGGVTTLWPRTLPHPVWWLTPEGSTTEVMIPSGPWNAGGGVFFTPSQRGVLVTYQGGVKSNRDPGTQGIYLVQENGGTEKLIGGLVHHLGVSPNGCKVAFSHAPNIEADRPDHKNRRTLKVIDVCSRGAQS
jgi:hypothetical protein